MPLVAADEIPKQVPLEAHGSFSIVLSNEDDLFLFPAHPLPLQAWAAPLPLQLFPKQTRGSCRLNCFLLLRLCTCQMRSDSNQVLFSAVLFKSNQNICSVGHDWKCIYFTLSPNGAVVLFLRQGYEGSWWIRTAFEAEPFPLVLSPGSLHEHLHNKTGNVELTWNFLHLFAFNYINL